MGGYGPAIAGEMSQRADEIHADNKQKKDEEHARKISDLILERQDLINKIPTLQQGTPEYMDAHTALQGVNGDIADVYHPQKNPGAIEKFGHLLTDHMKITNPEDRVVKQAAQKQGRTDAAAATTDRQIAAAPLSPAQLNAQKIQEQVKQINASAMSDEDKKAATQKVFGVVSKANWQQFKNSDGTLSYYDVTNPDSIPPGATAVAKGAITTAKEQIDEYQKEVADGKTTLSYPAWLAAKRREGAPSTSALNEGRQDYSMSHGFKSWEEIPAEYRDVAMNYMIRKQAMDKAYPTSTTTTALKLDAEGQFRPVTETNYKTPQGTETLKDPLWFLAAPAPRPGDGVKKPTTPTGAKPDTTTAPTSPSTPAAPPNVKTLKKEAATRAPKGANSTSSTSSNAGSGPSNTKVGGPIFAGPNKEYSDAKTTYDGAVTRQSLMHRNYDDALKNGSQQAMLSLLFNHIGMTQGAQKGARINQKSVDEAKASAPLIDSTIAKLFHQDQAGDYIYDGPKGGVNLTKEQMKQMVDLADESTGVFKQNMDRIHDRLNKGIPGASTAAGGGATPQSKGIVSVKEAMKKEKYKKMTKDQVSKAITAAGYTPLDD